MGDTARKTTQHIAALAAAGGALAAGTILGWTSPTEIAIKNGTSYDFAVSEEAFSWVSSMVPLGAAAICFPIGFLANIFGRKWTMLGLVVPFTIGWAMIIWAQNVAMLLVARFILGVAGGAFCVTAPMYTGEIAESSIRGALGSYFQLMITIGILFVYAVGAGAEVILLSIICGIIPLVFGVIFFFMPESPSYLVSKDKNDSALKSLKWLRGPNYDHQNELITIQRDNDDNKAQRSSFGTVITRRSTIMGIIIAFGLMLFQQLSGINAVIFYTTNIFEAADTGISSATATIIVGVIQVIATFVSSLVVDRLGRKLLLLQSALIMGLCLVSLGTYFYLNEQTDVDVSSLGFIPILSLCIFIVSFSLGFGPVPWLMAGEIFAADVKSYLVPVAGTTNWTLAFFITKFFGNLVNAINMGPTFWIFAGCCFVGFAFILFVIPETKGLSLIEIQRMLNGEKNYRNQPPQIIPAKE